MSEGILSVKHRISDYLMSCGQGPCFGPLVQHPSQCMVEACGVFQAMQEFCLAKSAIVSTVPSIAWASTDWLAQKMMLAKQDPCFLSLVKARTISEHIMDSLRRESLAPHGIHEGLMSHFFMSEFKQFEARHHIETM